MTDEKNILSVDADDEDIDLVSLSKHLEEDTRRKKNRTAANIDEWGEMLLKEVEGKRKVEELKSKKLIPYILKRSKGKYSKEELLSYSFKDVQDIYDEIKKNNQSSVVKFFHFLFNIE